jgi:hypothetical protein
MDPTSPYRRPSPLCYRCVLPLLPTVHQYTLKSRGRDYAFITVKSHALNAQDPPLLYFGEDITGFVILSLSDLSDMQRHGCRRESVPFPIGSDRH